MYTTQSLIWSRERAGLKKACNYKKIEYSLASQNETQALDESFTLNVSF